MLLNSIEPEIIIYPDTADSSSLIQKLKLEQFQFVTSFVSVRRKYYSETEGFYQLFFFCNARRYFQMLSQTIYELVVDGKYFLKQFFFIFMSGILMGGHTFLVQKYPPPKKNQLFSTSNKFINLCICHRNTLPGVISPDPHHTHTSTHFGTNFFIFFIKEHQCYPE